MENFNLNDLIATKEELEFTENKDLMKNRRFMAYFSLFTVATMALILVIFLVVTPTILNSFSKIESILSTIVLGFFSVIALYFGANSLSEVFGNKIK